MFEPIISSPDEGTELLEQIRVEFKHFLSDMYSVLNYWELSKKIKDGLIAPEDYRKVKIDWKVLDNPETLERLGGKDALRNISEHRHLPDLLIELNPEFSGNLTLFPEQSSKYTFVCPWIEGINIYYLFIYHITDSCLHLYR